MNEETQETRLKIGKAYICELMRDKHLTKKEASELYDYIRDTLINELKNGCEINLFSIAHVETYKHDGKKFNGFMNCKITDAGFRLKATVNRTLKDLFRKLNQDLGCLVD